MPGARTAALALVAALALPLLAGTVAGHASTGKINIAATTDRPRVGELVDLTYYLLDDGELVPHVDTSVEVHQNGDRLLKLDSTHEHDGVHRTAVRFVEPGPVQVRVAVDGEDVAATWTGRVVAPETTVDAALALDGPSTVHAGETATFDAEVTDDGEPVPHTDVRVRVYREPTDKLVRRTPLHFHDGTGSFDVSQLVPGDYRIQVEAYPGRGGPGFQPTAVERDLEVVAEPAPAVPEPTTVWSDSGGDGPLIVEVDPTTEVGPLADVKLNALYLNDTHPVHHVEYAHKLVGPDGRVLLSTEQAHAHDGIVEVLAHTPRPGTYTWTVKAQGPDADEPVVRQAKYTVTPPTTAEAPGTVHPDLPQAQAGSEAAFGLDFVAETGEPMHHVEADLEAYALGEDVPRWTAKLHAHEKRVEWTAASGETGPHHLKVNPSPQEPGAGRIQAPGGPTAHLGFAYDVDAAPIPADGGDGPRPAGSTVPVASWAVLAGLAAGALLVRRM